MQPNAAKLGPAPFDYVSPEGTQEAAGFGGMSLLKNLGLHLDLADSFVARLGTAIVDPAFPPKNHFHFLATLLLQESLLQWHWD
jgi:hypothetical protein